MRRSISPCSRQSLPWHEQGGKLWVPTFAGTTELLLHRDKDVPGCRLSRHAFSCRRFRESEDAEETYANLRNQVLGALVRQTEEVQEAPNHGRGCQSAPPQPTWGGFDTRRLEDAACR